MCHSIGMLPRPRDDKFEEPHNVDQGCVDRRKNKAINYTFIWCQFLRIKVPITCSFIVDQVILLLV